MLNWRGQRIENLSEVGLGFQITVLFRKFC